MQQGCAGLSLMGYRKWTAAAGLAACLSFLRSR
jgi:hypothetical protein